MADSQQAPVGKGPYFLFYRLWPGFTPSFPYERVDHLEGEEFGRGLDALVHEMQARVVEEFLKMRPDLKEARQETTPTKLSDHKRVKNFRGFGWMRGHIGVEGMATPKQWLCEILEEEMAAHVQAVLTKRFSGQGNNPRFGIVAAGSFDKATQALTRLEMEDAVQRLNTFIPGNQLEAEILDVILRLSVEPEPSQSKPAPPEPRVAPPSSLDGRPGAESVAEPDKFNGGAETAPVADNGPHLDPTDWSILRLLAQNQELRLLTSVIAERLDRKKAAIGKNLARLGDCGYISSVARKGYQITEEGLARVRAAP